MEKHISEIITDYLNTYSSLQPDFNNQMSKEHRTLQQSFTRICLQWLEYCASKEYRYDGRNEQSHLIAKALISSWQEKNGHNENPSLYLSFI